MNKSELIDAIAESADLSKMSAGRALDAVVEAIPRLYKRVTRFRWLALVLLLLSIGPPERAATQRQVMKSRLKRPMCLALKPVRRLKKRLIASLSLALK